MRDSCQGTIGLPQLLPIPSLSIHDVIHLGYPALGRCRGNGYTG
jgi:hypothetical protein